MVNRILLVDDQAHIREMLEIYLKNEGFEVDHAPEGSEALVKVHTKEYACIVLDLMMPKMTGEETLIQIRKFSNVPVLILSAKDQDMDKITGFSIGADDYVVKPFNPLELVARIKALIRRSQISYGSVSSPTEDKIYYRSLEINKKARTISYDGERIHTTPTEFDILLYMLENQGIVLTGEQIYQRVWNEEFIPSLNTVMVHIRNLREKIEKVTGEKIIQTVWGVGYKIEKEK